MTARPCSSELASALATTEVMVGAGIIGGPIGITES
jgi:ABC-type cobalt transport system substrate-binding protein